MGITKPRRPRLMAMRVVAPFAAFVVLVAVYSGYWFYLSTSLEATIHRLQSQWREAGVEIEYGELSVGGYPYRLEVIATDVKAVSRTAGVAWSWGMPVVRAVAHPWKLSHWVAVFEAPGEINLNWVTHQEIRLKVGRSRMSVNLGSEEFPDRVSLDLRDLRAQPRAGAGHVDISHFEIHVRRAVSISPNVDIVFFIEDLVFGQANGYIFGRDLQELSAEISLKGNLPSTRTRAALDEWSETGGLVEMHKLQMRWGDLDLQLDGTFAIDGQYRPIGAASAAIKGYPALLQELGRKGLISEPTAFAAGLAFDLLAERSSGDAQGLLRVPITIQDGTLSLGVIPLLEVDAIIAP